MSYRSRFPEEFSLLAIRKMFVRCSRFTGPVKELKLRFTGDVKELKLLKEANILGTRTLHRKQLKLKVK